jgi:hypothetical protein
MKVGIFIGLIILIVILGIVPTLKKKLIGDKDMFVGAGATQDCMFCGST